MPISTELRKRPTLREILNQDGLQLNLLCLLTTVFALTLWFSQSTFTVASSGSEARRGGVRIPFSSGLAVLRSLQALTSTCTTFALLQAFETLTWTLASRSTGLSILNFLSLAPTTSMFGGLALGFRNDVPTFGRIASWSKLYFTTTCWLAGVLLFIRTSFSTVYESGVPYIATAGTGPFNGSLVKPTLKDNGGSISYSILATAPSFLQNPQFAISVQPVKCLPGKEHCESYLLPGGLMAVSSNIPNGTSDPLIIIHDAPASQVEFRTEGAGNAFSSSVNCSTFGDRDIGIRLCLQPSVIYNGSVDVGIIACPRGISNGLCLGGGDQYNVSTTVSIFKRRVTTTCSKDNKTIISVSGLTTPTSIDFSEVEPLHEAFDWLLNYTAAGLPIGSSPVFLFWNRNGVSEEHDWSVTAYEALQNMLAFILWEFSINSWGNPDMHHSAHGPDGEVAFLPQEFRTTIASARPLTKFVIDRKMFALYILFQGIPVLFCWVVMAVRVAMRMPRPKTSSFPTMDVVFKSNLAGCPISDGGQLIDGGDATFVKSLQGVRIVAK
ncbi:hypothetical protein BCR34DRAFT_494609 [Clohesyomyces aquaticus]|uniref:Uncharacterized protein n=1 Tax=Clohesyomyces aquaticus TaxID=1231657 RepID=A0A1Y1YRC4_9PLEO|nr:hypothetical protein BCR34DRAFT_494609 [Clohesyomyces aquaticus]